MKVAIVMTYVNRQAQFNRAIASIFKQEYSVHVIVVDDCSEIPLTVPDNYPVEVIRINEKDWFDKDIPLNIGIVRAITSGADLIILQNAECYHVGDVIRYALKVTDKTYLSFGCFSLGRERTERGEDPPIVNRGATFDGDEAWYNHPLYFPRGYDWCSAITAENMRKLNGMDERFAYGVAYGDNDFLRRVKALGLTVEITSFPYVVHQWHYTPKNIERITSERWEMNRLLYESMKTSKNYRAIHTKTGDFDAL